MLEETLLNQRATAKITSQDTAYHHPDGTILIMLHTTAIRSTMNSADEKRIWRVLLDAECGRKSNGYQTAFRYPKED